MKHRRGVELIASITPARHFEYQPTGSVYETIAQLREWEVLGAKCGKCGHTTWLNKEAVLRRYGNQYLQNIGRKLVCRCGNAEGNRVLVGQLGRD